MCLELKVQQVRCAWIILHVENQVANCRLKFTAFKIKNTVFVIYLKIENWNEAMNWTFSDLKARSKVGMKYFHVKMTAVMLLLSFEGAIMDLYRS